MSYSDMGGGRLTPLMIRNAIEELQQLRLRVPVAMILNYLQKHFPFGGDADRLNKEFVQQSDKAVKLGWITRYPNDTYSLTTLRYQAYVDEYGYDTALPSRRRPS